MFTRKKLGGGKSRISRWNLMWIFCGVPLLPLLFSMMMQPTPVFARFNTDAIYNRPPGAHLALVAKTKIVGVTTVKLLADTITLKLIAEKDPVGKLGIRQLIKHYGYPVEEHTFYLSDGYLATLHRIPGEKGTAANYTSKRGFPVFLQHGLFSTGISWLHLGPTNLPFLLADAGFDVFIGSQRGTTLGLEHQTIKKESYNFWKFGFDEIAQIEIPGLIDYILNLTQYPQLNYVSYSVGSTSLLLALASQPDYNEKIQRVSLLAPVGYFSRTTSPLFASLSSMPHDNLEKVFSPITAIKRVKSLNHKELPPACQIPLGDSFCSVAYLLIVGLSYLQNNFQALARHTLHISFTPPRILVQLVQWKMSARMSYYDHGKRENLRRYGQPQPPDYNLNTIRTPIQAFYNTEDVVANVTDTLMTLNETGPCFINPTTANLEHTNFNHLDFIYNSKAPGLIYRHVVHFLQTGEPSADPAIPDPEV